MARGFPAAWLIAGCACAWQRGVAGYMAGSSSACTNRPRLCLGHEADICGLRLETWRGLSPLFPCEEKPMFLFYSHPLHPSSQLHGGGGGTGVQRLTLL